MALPDSDPRIEAIGLERARTVGAPMIVIGMAVAFLLSIPSGVPLTTPVIVSNIVYVSLGALIWGALAAHRVPASWAHGVSAGVWCLAAANTLTTLYFTREPNLSFPFLLELALACVVQVSRRWLLFAIGLASAIWLPLILRDPGPHVGVQLGCVGGLLICAALISGRLRRSLDDALVQEQARARTAAELSHELEERRRVEEERELLRDQFAHAQRLEATGTLAAGLAHDMNNILGAIIGQAQLLAEQPVAEAAKAELAQIVREGERGAALTRSLLAFARQGQYTRRPLLIEGVLREMETLLSRVVSKKAIVEWHGHTDAVVDCDAAQIRQVLVNLCINAADAIESTGDIRIDLGVTNVEGPRARALKIPPGHYAFFSVKDSGSGMTEEVRAKVFEPFFTTKPVGRGTGLGLAMVHGTVGAHGGAIEVESDLEVGSTFRILLPITDRPVAAEPIRVASPALEAGPRVALVVDDEPMFRQITTRMLERLGHTVFTAADGAEAVQVFAANRSQIGLVVLDMSMPVMDGPECFARLRALEPVPILLVSGYTDGAETQRLIDIGVTRFLEKPFRLETFSEAVSALLGRAQPPAPEDAPAAN